MEKISRRKFLERCLSALALIPLSGLITGGAFAAPAAKTPNGRTSRGTKGAFDLVVVKGDDPARITREAVAAMGGMERFVRKNDVVVVKPNIGWDRIPEQAGNTNPAVVAALVAMAFEAGAKRVNVFDVTCNDPRRCYASSGIERAAKEKGANVYFADDWNTVAAHFDYESPLEGWPVLKDALECDTLINVPVLKNHGLTGLTLSMKNLMGVCSGNRGTIHRDIGRKLVDLTDFVKPDLTIIDAYRVLLRNGPTGGDLADVAVKKTVIAATDPVLADTYAATFMGIDPMSLSYITSAVSRKFGSTDIEGARTKIVEI